MIKKSQSESLRKNHLQIYNVDVVIVGGGMAGSCAAITAARAGSRVVLVQDRPVLGGNSSSEVRLWILGATSHMGNNNRWAREGGIIDEILVENLFRNKEGNAVIFDTIVLEKVTNEPNIILLLNTSVFELSKQDERTIESARAYCSQNSTEYLLKAPVFIDSSGDGILGFLSGAPFRMGSESKEEFGELFAPDEEFGSMLGHTIYFYSKDTGHPVKYVPPSYALKEIEQIPRYKSIDSKMNGCQFWWFEYGGRSEDPVKETEKIKWELWKVVYGAWDYIKNSGNFPEAQNLTLEWVGTIPGKRESRRFEGEYMLKQQDIVEQKIFTDAVAFGGWSLDLHPADGVYSKLPGCTQWHSKGIFQIPYRAYISKSINNLFFAGRIISATHVAFGSTRVMATSAHGGQAVGMAAAVCAKYDIDTKQILHPDIFQKYQNLLSINGQSIPEVPIDYSMLTLPKPNVTVSSTYKITGLPFDGEWIDLNEGFSQLLPLKKGIKYGFRILVNSQKTNPMDIQLRTSSRLGHYTPDEILESVNISTSYGKQFLNFSFEIILENDQYVFLTILPNSSVKVMTSNQRLPGILSLSQKKNLAVSNNGKQVPPDGIGIESFELWTPARRPGGKNLAFDCNTSLEVYDKEYINNGYVRPYLNTNAWAASLDDKNPELVLTWDAPQKIKKIRLFFDTDYDHPMESVLMGHPEDVIPFCTRNYKVFDKDDNLLFEKTGNYQTINDIEFEHEKVLTELKFQFQHPSKNIPASLFEIICFNEKLLI